MPTAQQGGARLSHQAATAQPPQRPGTRSDGKPEGQQPEHEHSADRGAGWTPDRGDMDRKGHGCKAGDHPEVLLPLLGKGIGHGRTALWHACLVAVDGMLMIVPIVARAGSTPS